MVLVILTIAGASKTELRITAGISREPALLMFYGAGFVAEVSQLTAENCHDPKQLHSEFRPSLRCDP